MEIHHLKTHTDYFNQVAHGNKTFEVRKNDRNFQTFDILCLENYDGQNNQYKYGYVLAEVTYILKGGQFGIEDGYVVMGLKILIAKF